MASSAKETGEPRSSEEEVSKDHAGTLRTLPEGLEPNPPSLDDLKSHGLTWKGEYEATKDGKPSLGPDARPIPVLYNKKGKRVKSHIKQLKTHPLNLENGTLTVDGWTGKARLNYEIPVQSFVYVSTPNMGTIIISQTAFPGSKEQKEAFNDKTLTMHVDDHEVQLASDKPLCGKKPESAWVRVDPAFHIDARYPVMGFGSVTNAPYSWPAAAAKADHGKGIVKPPPLPNSMLQRATSVCIQKTGTICPQPVAPASASGTPAMTSRSSTPLNP